MDYSAISDETLGFVRERDGLLASTHTRIGISNFHHQKILVFSHKYEYEI